MAKKRTTKKNTKANAWGMPTWVYNAKIWGIGSFVVIVALLFANYHNDDSEFNLSERDTYYYKKALAQVQEVDSIWNVISLNATPKQLQQLISKISKLKYEYNDKGMNLTTLKVCDSLKQRIEFLQTDFMEDIKNNYLNAGKQIILHEPNKILSSKTIFPFFLRKGEKLYLDVHATGKSNIALRNVDVEKLIKSYPNRVIDTMLIANEGIYALEISPKEKQYVSINIGYKPVSGEDLENRPQVMSQKVECTKEEYGAEASKGIKMQNIFEEPRKFTLRGQIKAAFSGSARALVAIRIPAGATDILYSMRIDTSEGGKSEDGKFYNNLNYSYRKINMLGLPVYESTKSSGILNMILDDNRPIRDEDAYCNMYVFRNQSQAKKFQDGTHTASELTYDVDYSTLGTQSCNGRIPVNGSKTIYLGFENERMRYTNYLWVEAVAVIPTTVYHKEKYTIK